MGDFVGQTIFHYQIPEKPSDSGLVVAHNDQDLRLVNLIL